MSRIYTNRDCVKFVKDMEAAGLEVEHYCGRNFWRGGPAVRVDSIQDALSKTKVRCKHDSLGRGYIVYPVARDEGIDDEATVESDIQSAQREGSQPEPAGRELPAHLDEDEDPDAELLEQYHEFMGMYEDLKRELRRRNPREFERWKAGGFLIDSDIISMYPTLGVALEIEEE